MPSARALKKPAPERREPTRQAAVRPASGRRTEVAIALSFVALSLWMTGEIFSGQRPLSWDHHVHYGRAWYFIHHLIPNLTLWNWNDAWLAGYPVNYNYAFLADVIVALVHGLTLGLAPLGFAYTVVVLGVHFIEGYSVYWLGKKIGLRWAGLLGGWAMATHLGGGLTGGWHWTHYAGVWPVGLAVAMGLFHFGYFHALMEKPDRKTTAIAGLILGLSLLTHPLMMIYTALMAFFMPLSALLLEKKLRIERWKHLALMFTIAGAIGCLWILPFLSITKFAEHYWDPGPRLPELAKRAWEGKLFEGLWPIFGLAGLAGLTLFGLSRKPARFVAAVSSLMLVTLGTVSFFEYMELGKISESFYHVQFSRFHMLIKPFFLLAGAMVILEFCAHISRQYKPLENWKASTKESPWLWIVSLGFLFALVGPGLGPNLKEYTFKKFGPLAPGRDQPNLELMLNWIRDVEKQDSRFFRVAVWSNNGDFKDLITEIRSPIYGWDNYTPAINFKDGPQFTDEPSLKFFNVRYLLWQGTPSPLEGKTGWETKATFGPYTIAEYKDWSPDFYSIDGAGAFSETLRQPNRISLRVEPGTHGKIVVHKSYFDRWQATWNGKPVTTEVQRFAGKFDFLSARLPDNKGGTLEFFFETGRPEKRGVLFFLLGLGLFALVYFGKETAGQTLRRLKARK